MGRGSAEESGAVSAQAVALSVGVGKQRDRSVVTVPGRDDADRQTTGQHETDAGIA